MGKESSTIVAFAGRRIDATEAEIPRFPLTQVEVVQKKTEELFSQRQCQYNSFVLRPVERI